MSKLTVSSTVGTVREHLLVRTSVVLGLRTVLTAIVALVFTLYHESTG